MSTNQFEVAFVVETIADPFDPRIDHAEQSLLGLVVSNTGPLTTATALVEAPTVLEAAIHAAQVLDASGIDVERSYPDLVTRGDIAERLGVTRQAVGLWIRGERKDAHRFPTPTSMVAGGVWLWGDVVEWARLNGVDTESVEYPTFDDHVRIDALLQRGVRHIAIATYATAETLAFSTRSMSKRVEHIYQQSYALAS